MPPQPAHFISIAKIKNALDDIFSVFFGLNGFWVHIPKQFGPEFDGPGRLVCFFNSCHIPVL